MTKVEYGKSKKYYSTHCGLCGKKMRDTEPRVNGHVIFKNDVEEDIIAHESCVKVANIDTAIKQTKELGKHDAHTPDIQPEDPKMSPGGPENRSGTEPEKIS